MKKPISNFQIAALVFSIVLAPELLHVADSVALTSAAASASALDPAYDKLNGIVSGSFAKIISLTSLAFGLVGSAMRFNPAAIGSAFGVSIAAGVGPSVMGSVLGALI
jgi:hypothetical protein